MEPLYLAILAGGLELIFKGALMEPLYLAILAGGLALIFCGVRMIWCGHRAHTHLHADRRHDQRRTTKRGADRRLS